MQRVGRVNATATVAGYNRGFLRLHFSSHSFVRDRQVVMTPTIPTDARRPQDRRPKKGKAVSLTKATPPLPVFTPRVSLMKPRISYVKRFPVCQ